MALALCTSRWTPTAATRSQFSIVCESPLSSSLSNKSKSIPPSEACPSMNRAAAVPFVKASACGNDFILIDGMHAPADLSGFTRRICDRYNGVGADGVEWLFPDPKQEADVRGRLFNADGSEAEISGNGTRCVAAYWLEEHEGNRVTVRTGAGLKRCELIKRAGNRFIFDSEMGEPDVGEEFSIKLAFSEVKGVPVSMGNPHFVIFVDDFSQGCQAE